MPAVIVHNTWLTSFDTSVRPCVLHLDKAKLTLAEAFEPGRFSAKQTKIPKGDLLLLKASEGWCWALIRDLDDNGCWILEREASASAPVLPLVEESTRSRRAAA